MNVYLSVVIPAYNEEKRISKTLLEIDKYLSKQSYSYEIIVVSDGSKDNTGGVVRELMPRIKNLELIDNKEKVWTLRPKLISEDCSEKIELLPASNKVGQHRSNLMLSYYRRGTSFGTVRL